MRKGRGNLATGLKTRRRGQPAMQRFDRLPAELRRWLAEAALPWSPRSALRLWQAALSESGGCRTAARDRLETVERRLLDRDARRVWGPGYPGGKP